jgi:hypothetical protein
MYDGRNTGTLVIFIHLRVAFLGVLKVKMWVWGLLGIDDIYFRQS